MKKTYGIVSVEDAIRIKARGLRREHLEIYIAGREKRVEPYWRAREQVPRDRQADKSLVIEAVLRSLGYVRREGDEE